MNLIEILYIVFTTMVVSLGLVHLLFWCTRRDAKAYGLFAVAAFASAAFSVFELLLMKSTTVEEAGTIIRWAHVPLFFVILSLVGFVRTYLRAGRVWLAWLVCILRATELCLNFLLPPNINFREITSLRPLHLLGTTVVTPQGEPNPWMLVSHFGGLAFCAFLLDATWTVWRRGGSTRHRLFGVALCAYFISAQVGYILLFWGWIATPPYLYSLSFCLVLLAVGVDFAWNLMSSGLVAEKLMISEAKYRRMFEHAQDIFLQTDKNGMILEISPSIQKYCGYSREELMGKPVLMLYEDHNERAGLLAALASKGEVVDYELRLKSKNNERIFVSLNAHYLVDSDGARLGIEGLLRDITLKKQAEDAIRSSEIQFKSTFSENPVPMSVSDLEEGGFP